MQEEGVRNLKMNTVLETHNVVITSHELGESSRLKGKDVVK